jgi:hypothetical protein
VPGHFSSRRLFERILAVVRLTALAFRIHERFLFIFFLIFSHRVLAVHSGSLAVDEFLSLSFFILRNERYFLD